MKETSPAAPVVPNAIEQIAAWFDAHPGLEMFGQTIADQIRELAALPVEPSPVQAKEQVRMLTTAETDMISQECEAWLDSHVAEAIQRKFCEVNGLALPDAGGEHGL